jgi:hypothetical protein
MTAIKTSWLKIRNRAYSQMQGRNDLFDRMAHRKHEAAETDGWATVYWRARRRSYEADL